MASFTRTNGLGHAHATLYSTNNISFFVVDCDGSGTDISGKGGIGSSLEALAQAINPIVFDSEGTAGLVNFAVDGSQWDAASLQVAIRNIGTVDSYNFAAAAVTAGGQVIVGA